MTEILGASDELAYVSEEAFLLRSFAPSPQVVELVGERVRLLSGAPLRARALPGVMYTDGRSFLAHGIPALERAGNLLEAVVRHADQNPGVLESMN